MNDHELCEQSDCHRRLCRQQRQADKRNERALTPPIEFKRNRADRRRVGLYGKPARNRKPLHPLHPLAQVNA